MRWSATAAVLLALVVGSLALNAYLYSYARPPRSTGTGTSSFGTSTDCFITGLPGGENVQVLSDSGSPLAGVQITGRSVEDQCGDFSIPTETTNSTGWISLPGEPGAYSLVVSFSGRNFEVGAPMYPISLTTIKIRVPSGFWTIDVRYGTFSGIRFAGPSYTSAVAGNLQLNVTLGNSSVTQGYFLPMRVSFVGPGASNASNADVSLVVTNSQGVVVGNFSQSVESLDPVVGAYSLRGFSTHDGWNAVSHPPEFSVPVTPGAYILTVSSEIGGKKLTASGVVEVAP